MAQILLVEGKHHNLIEEIKEITSDNLSEDSLDDEEKYLEKGMPITYVKFRLNY